MDSNDVIIALIKYDTCLNHVMTFLEEKGYDTEKVIQAFKGETNLDHLTTVFDEVYMISNGIRVGTGFMKLTENVIKDLEKEAG